MMFSSVIILQNTLRWVHQWDTTANYPKLPKSVSILYADIFRGLIKSCVFSASLSMHKIDVELYLHTKNATRNKFPWIAHQRRNMLELYNQMRVKSAFIDKLACYFDAKNMRKLCFTRRTVVNEREYFTQNLHLKSGCYSLTSILHFRWFTLQ